MSVSLYVGNLPFQVKEDDLVELFRPFGTVIRVRIPTDHETHRPRGFGFVEIESDGADRAVTELNGVQFFGRTLAVNPARPREASGRRV
ncbi:MAG TPA: RNA-binding protein [Candidatus Acidoferrales bacterium]|nr:RNA-binding protein [Candidatus Acidoferrales bacterium]